MIPESEPRQNFNPSEDKTRLDPTQEATNLLTALREIEGNRKALVFIVDDMPSKRGDAERFLTESSAARDTSFIFSSKGDGESAISLFQQVRRQEPKGEQSTVVVMLDGNLKDPNGIYNYGDEVAGKLMEISAENEWEAPYLVGMSFSPNENRILRETFPQNYIDTFDNSAPEGHKTALLDAIDSRLTPPQTPPQQ
jgi:hypothetical protein